MGKSKTDNYSAYQVLNALTITVIRLLPKMHTKMTLKEIIKARSP